MDEKETYQEIIDELFDALKDALEEVVKKEIRIVELNKLCRELADKPNKPECNHTWEYVAKTAKGMYIMKCLYCGVMR